MHEYEQCLLPKLVYNGMHTVLYVDRLLYIKIEIFCLVIFILGIFLILIIKLLTLLDKYDLSMALILIVKNLISFLCCN